MAIRYLYPIPAPICLQPDLPPGFELDDEQRAKLPKLDTDDFLKALRNHKAFTRPKVQVHWDAIDLMIVGRKTRRAADPAAPDYYDVPGPVLKILQDCATDPVFYQPFEGGGSWMQGFPFEPRMVREILKPGGFVEMLKAAKDLKPSKVEPDQMKEEVTKAGTAAG